MTPSVVRRYQISITTLVFLLDRVTKWLVEQRIPMHQTIGVVPGFFSLTHVLNPGAAFSLFSEPSSKWKVTMLIAFSVLALVVVAVLLWKSASSRVITSVSLALIMGGALGNLWDRVSRGEVVDFLLFYVGPHQWPVFNLADSAIVVGAILLVAEMLFLGDRKPASA